MKTTFRKFLSAFKQNKTPGSRIQAIDALRGRLMVVMALDHANQFISHGKQDPELWADMFPSYNGDWIAFLVRLVTHIAAPGFFFLMGTGMFLFTAAKSKKGWSKTRISGHFLTRGALLVAAQFLLENPAWRLDPHMESNTYFGVLYALGGTMILWGLFIHLSPRWILIVSTILLVSTQFLLPFGHEEWHQFPSLLRIWLVPGYSNIDWMGEIFVLYPVYPWLGLVGLGIVFGNWVQQDRKKALAKTSVFGGISLVFFLVLRFAGDYGNIRPFPANGDWIDFLNMTKYPPSLVFLLFTMSINFLILYGLSRSKPYIFQSPLAILGREPFFFYLVHLYIYGLLGLMLTGHTISIPGMLPIWIGVVVLLIPVTWLYGEFKRTRSPDSLWRLL